MADPALATPAHHTHSAVASGVERQRATGLAAGVLGATVVGSVYAFSILSHPMKHQFHLNQEDINVVVTIAFSLAQFNIPAGWLLDRFGAPAVNLVAFSTIAVGLSFLALIFYGVIPGTVGTLLLGYSLATWPSGFVDIGTVLPNLYTFPRNRGDVVIVQKTYMGLGASVFATVFIAVFGDEHIAGYCLFCAAVSLLACFVTTTQITAGPAALAKKLASPWWMPVFIPPSAKWQSRAAAKGADNGDASSMAEMGSDDATRAQGAAQRDEALDAAVVAYVGASPAPPRVMYTGFGLLGLSLAVLLAAAIVNAAGLLKHWPLSARVVLACVAVLLVLSFVALRFVAALPPRSCSGEGTADYLLNPADGDRASTGVNLLPNTDAHDDEANHGSDGFFPAGTVREAVVSWPFLFLYVAMVSQLGAGALLAANATQIYRAVNDGVFHSSTNAMLTSVAGIGSAFGRIVAGLLQRNATGRSTPLRLSLTVFLPIPGVLFAVALVSFTFLPTDGLGAAFFLSHVAYGLTWALVIMSAQLVWRPAVVGRLYACLFTAGLIASLVFNLGFFGPRYDALAKEQHQHVAVCNGTAVNVTHAEKQDAHCTTCAGVECFDVPLLVLAAGNIVSAVASWAFHRCWLGTRQQPDAPEGADDGKEQA